MKIAIACTQCETDTYIDMQNVNESGLYQYECPNGHKTIISLQNWKHEILFEMGINAFLDEYYREAVVNFATALERFYEYSILVFCYYSDIPKEEIDKVWKIVSKQSERQLGAYCFLYLQTLKKNPNIFNEKLVKFRNDVVHRGYIPNREEAFNYGKEVAEYIQNNQKVYKEILGNTVLGKVQFDYLVNRKSVSEQNGQTKIWASLYENFEDVISKGKKRF